jgi:heme oxygenase
MGMDASPFQIKLKEQTAELHKQAEGHPLMQSFISSSYKKEHLLQFLVNLLPIYSVVEQKLLANQIINEPGLRRSPLLQQDIDTLSAEIINEDNQHLLALLPCTNVWVSNMWKKSIELLKAELYTRWLADLYGGRMLARTVSPNAMYTWDNPQNIIGIVREVVDISPTDEVRFIDEVNNFFTYHITLFDNIYNDETSKG